MGRYTTRLITGLAAASLLAGSAFAQATNIVDDLEHGGNLNNWNGYWYLYATEGASIANAGPPDAYGPMSFKPEQGVGRSQSWAAVLEIGDFPAFDQGGPTYEAWLESYPEVGIATMLTQDTLVGMGSGFSSATAIKFWARATDTLTITFKVETVENASAIAQVYDMASKGMWNSSGQPQTGANPPVPTTPADHPKAKTWSEYVAAEGLGSLAGPPTFPLSTVHTYNAYFKNIVVGQAWTEITVPIGDATLPSGVTEGAAIKGLSGTNNAAPSWTAGGTDGLKQDGYWGAAYAFKKTKATRLAWVIKKQENISAPSGAKLFIDDISVVGYEYEAPDLCKSCNFAPGIPATNATLLSDFDEVFADANGNSSARVNALQGYWYFYNDGEAGGGSDIFGELETGIINSDGDTGDVLSLGGNGNASDGPFITFTIGPSFNDARNGASINGFVGIGTNLYNPDAEEVSYLAAGDAQGFYFEYKVDGDVSTIFIEVDDKTSVEANNGEVYYVRIPVKPELGNKNTWRGAYVYFADLVLPFWADRTASLDLNNLAKFQFKVQGSADMYGELSIDNVYLLTERLSVRQASSSRSNLSGLRATYNRGTVGVNWNAPAQIRDGKISLINVRGRTVASAPVRNVGNRVQANLGANRVPAGMYFVRVNAKDVNGKRIVQQTPITITK